MLLRRLAATRAAVPPDVRRISTVSFWMDAASELVYPLVPLFLTATLGAPVAAVGLVEAVGDAISTLLSGPAGALSDRIGRRRPLAAGYALSALTKPAIALADGWGVVLALRSGDRLGKALRKAPRDALIADHAGPGRVGLAFGYHRMLDNLGAGLGPLVGVLVLAAGVGIRDAILLATVPAALAIVLVTRVREAPARVRASADGPRLRDAAVRGPVAWITVAWIVFSLGNSADAFVLLRASDLGLSAAQVVAVYAGTNLAGAAVALPAGLLGDRAGLRPVLVAGFALFALAYAGFALAASALVLVALVPLYGAYRAFTDGTVRALAAAHAPEGRTGATLGLVAAAGGVASLVASLAAGILWDVVGPAWVFGVGAALAVAAATILAVAPLGRPARAA